MPSPIIIPVVPVSTTDVQTTKSQENNVVLTPFSGSFLKRVISPEDIIAALEKNKDNLSKKEEKLFEILKARYSDLKNLEEKIGKLPSDLKKSFQEKDLKEAKEGLSIILSPLESKLNKELKDIPSQNRYFVQPSGIHVPKSANANIPERLRRDLGTGKIKPTNEQQNALIVKLERNDVAPLPRSKTENDRDFIGFFKPDGTTFAYTLFPEHAFSRVGIPMIIPTKSSGEIKQSVDPNSLKRVSYEDPRDGKIKQGVYFQVKEGNGVNGAIIPANQSLIIVDNENKKAYIVKPQ